MELTALMEAAFQEVRVDRYTLAELLFWVTISNNESYSNHKWLGRFNKIFFNYAEKEPAIFSGATSNDIMLLTKSITSAELLNLHHRTTFQAHVYPLSECNGSSPWNINNIEMRRKEKKEHTIIKVWTTHRLIIPWYFASSCFSPYKNGKHLNILIPFLITLTNLQKLIYFTSLSFLIQKQEIWYHIIETRMILRPRSLCVHYS